MRYPVTLTSFTLLLLFVTIAACAQDSYPSGFSYSLNQPDQSWDLQNDLKEISGLSISPDGKGLLAVQDEKGIIFSLETTTGKISGKAEFWKDGDYEGVENIPGGNTWVVKSNGTLYEVIDRGKEKKPHVVRHDLDFKRKFDVEGLAYDPFRNILLLSCKGDSDVKGIDDDEVRAIYGFDPEKEELTSDEPLFAIEWDDLKDFIKEQYPQRGKDIFSKFFDDDLEEVPFAPSGIAVHPENGNLFILSSVGKTLLVLSSEGQMLHLLKLDKKVHRQPEGISFNSEGVLFISNESKKGEDARLLLFNPR